MNEKVKKGNVLLSDKYKEAYNELSSKYPKLFNNQEIKLLKVGIKKEIIARGNLTITKSQLAKFLKVYCTGCEYKKLHIENASRYDLEGNESGVVTKKHVEGLIKLREETKKKRELKKQKQKELVKKQKENKDNNKVKSKDTGKNQKRITHSKIKNYLKVRKPTVTQDNIGNFINNMKSKLGIKA